MMARTFWWLGCIFGVIAVAAGAFGAHALRARLPADLLAVFETGARYQMYHALALLAVALLAARAPSPRWAASASSPDGSRSRSPGACWRRRPRRSGGSGAGSEAPPRLAACP